MKKYFFAGLIIIVPVVITILILTYLLNIFTEPFVRITHDTLLHFDTLSILKKSHHVNAINFVVRIFVLILLISITTVVGFLGRRYLFKTAIKLIDKLFTNIPVVRSIYNIARDVTSSFLEEETQAFEKTVAVPFPKKDTYAIGFLTGDIPKAIEEKSPTQLDKVIYVPTAPHPIAGFLLMTPQKNIHEIDVSVEDAFKFLISCGTIDSANNKTPQKKASSTKKRKKKKS